MNPYQRIIRDGREVQRGHVDTHAKFRALTSGLDLAGLSVLDVGCNNGEMCHLARAAGAKVVKGIDIEASYIADARRLNPDCSFDVRPMERATGKWDLILASGCLHYVSIPAALAQFARIAQVVACDVWISEGAEAEPSMHYSQERGLFYPSWDLWLLLAARSWMKISDRGPSLSPDASIRRVFHLSLPLPVLSSAVLIYGRGGAGKTSAAGELARGKGFEHLQLDSIFLEWRINVERSTSLSVSDFVEALWASGDSGRVEKYMAFHERYLERWLGGREGLDVVIEGFDMVYDPYRYMVRALLFRLGWEQVRNWEMK